MIPEIKIQLYDDAVLLVLTDVEGNETELKWHNENNKPPIEKITKRINEVVNSWYEPTFKLKI